MLGLFSFANRNPNLDKRDSEYNDLATKNPDKLAELQKLFLTEAGKYNVFPLDNSDFR